MRNKNNIRSFSGSEWGVDWLKVLVIDIKNNWKGGFKNKMKKKKDVHQNSIYFFINGI